MLRRTASDGVGRGERWLFGLQSICCKPGRGGLALDEALVFADGPRSAPENGKIAGRSGNPQIGFGSVRDKHTEQHTQEICQESQKGACWVCRVLAFWGVLRVQNVGDLIDEEMVVRGHYRDMRTPGQWDEWIFRLLILDRAPQWSPPVFVDCGCRHWNALRWSFISCLPPVVLPPVVLPPRLLYRPASLLAVSEISRSRIALLHCAAICQGTIIGGRVPKTHGMLYSLRKALGLKNSLTSAKVSHLGKVDRGSFRDDVGFS
ncbi:hypothetical protein BJ322DRAFT_1018071 [Thelephora terrestris]|uniref:Uncharacterized protein n=1 Tax=Thelephora terrestris TaxID=56493 RepID=A0A9P6HLC2_9AGAM|nr:hypothetical protein BJ322DRAFT_1018071 [Thelephora terrestris]